MSRHTAAPSLPSQFRDLRDEYRSDYTVGDSSQYVRNRKGLYGTADQHLGDPSKFYKRIEIARDLYRNEPVVEQVIERAVTQTIRSGFEYEPQTGDKELDMLLWKRQNDWRLDPDQCSEDGQSTFPDIEKQVATSEIVDGDVFVHSPPEDLRLQLFEADEVRSSNWLKDKNQVLGVQLGANRRREKYHVVKPGQDLGLWRTYNNAQLQSIDAYNGDGTPRVLHLMRTGGRAKVTRGITALHALIETVGMHGDIAFTLLVKQQMAASLGWEIQDDDSAIGATGGGFGAVEDSSRGRDGTIIEREGMAPGTVVRMRKGEKIVMHAPNIPSHETMEHLKRTLELFANGIGLPLLVVTMNASDGNFSTVRFCFDIAKMGFMERQDRFERRLHRPIVKRNIMWWVRNDVNIRSRWKLLKDPLSIFQHAWHKPRWPYPQPLQDAQADATQLDYYLNDPYEIAAGRGRDADDIRDRTIAYHGSCIEAAIAEAKRIKELTGVDVHWSAIMNRAAPKGTLMTDPAAAIDDTNDNARRQKAVA